MICVNCRDFHNGNDLAFGDGGVSLALGNCRSSGRDHRWGKGHFVADIPIIFQEGEYRSRFVKPQEAWDFVRAPLIYSALMISANSKLLSHVLDMPLVHKKMAALRLDVGDAVLAPLWKDLRVSPPPPEKARYDVDYRIMIVERTA